MKNTLLAVLAAFALVTSSAFAACKNCDEKAKAAHHEKHGKGGCKHCDEHAKAAKKEECKGKDCEKPADEQRGPSSSADFSGNTAKMIFEGLPGAADKIAGGLQKEGDLLCYQKGETFLCTMRGEDEETGRFEGAAAKEIYAKIASGGEYEDKLGTAREAAVACTLKAGKHACELQE